MRGLCRRDAAHTGDAAASYYATTVSYFADVTIPELNPAAAPHISALTCQPTLYGSSTQCSSPYTCSTTGTPLPRSLQCTPGQYFVSAGRMVISCGSRTQVTSGGTLSVYGTSYAKAYVRVD